MNLLQQKLGRLEQVFLALLLADLALYFAPAAAGIGAIVTLAVYITGAIVIVRIVRKNLKQIIWRLRNRLIVSYLFIAVVPIALLMLLVGIGGYILMGQMAIYVVNTELDRLSAGRSGTVLSPELLSNVAPNLGDVLFAEWSSGSNPDLSFRNLRRGHLPPPANPLDIELTWLSPITSLTATATGRLPVFKSVRVNWPLPALISPVGVPFWRNTRSNAELPSCPPT